MSVCYQHAGMLSAVAAELTSSQILHLSARDCAAVLHRHRQHITVVLDDMSVICQNKLSISDLSSLDASAFSLVSVVLAVLHAIACLCVAVSGHLLCKRSLQCTCDID